MCGARRYGILVRENAVFSSMPRPGVDARSRGAALVVADRVPADLCFDAIGAQPLPDDSIYIANCATKRLSDAAANSCVL
jgi:hypothetical protein